MKRKSLVIALVLSLIVGSMSVYANQAPSCSTQQAQKVDTSKFPQRFLNRILNHKAFREHFLKVHGTFSGYSFSYGGWTVDQKTQMVYYLLEVRTKRYDGGVFPVVERYGMDLKTMMVYYYDVAEDSYLLIQLK